MNRQTPNEVRAGRKILASIVLGNELEGILSSTVKAAARLCRVPMVAITLLTEKGDELELVALSGAHDPLIRRRFPVAESLNGIVIDSGRSFRSTDLTRERRRLPHEIARRNDVRAVLIVPLPGPQSPIGTLALADRRSRRFTGRQEAVVVRLARCASLAIADASLRRRPRPLPAAVRRAVRESADPGSLTPREREIMGLLAADKSCKEVASILEISNRTLEHHIERLKLRYHRLTLHGLVGHFAQRRF